MGNIKTIRKLNDIEQAVLVSVLALDAEAYGVAVKEEAERRTARKLATGTVYAVLSKAEDAGLVESRLGEPTPERGGRRKRFYAVTDHGRRALSEAHRSTVNLWNGFTAVLS
jgi:PadR family transcriptional regulator, regulatory protein PadR